MSRDEALRRILDGGIVAVVRSESPDQLVKVVAALAEGGVTAAEITFTVPNAIEVIREVRAALGDRVVLGAGTVLDPETARAALKHSDRAYVLETGSIILRGTASDVAADARVREAYLGE